MNDLPDDLDLLLALDVLLAERHVTRAARRLGVTQSAMSQRLSQLRDFFGDPLLVRGGPHLVTTPRAESMAGPLSRALVDLKAAVRAGASFDPREARRRFTILAGDLFEVLALPDLVRLLAEEAPHVDIIVDRADADFMRQLESGAADVVVMPLGVLSPSLRRTKLPDGRFRVVMRRGHPAARGRLTMKKYLSYPHLLIAPRGMPGSIVDAALEAKGLSRRVAVRVQHFSTAPFVLAKSNLLLTCPELSAIFAARVLDVHVADAPVDLGPDRVALGWHERMHGDPAHSWFRSRLEQMMRQGWPASGRSRAASPGRAPLLAQ